MTEIDFLQEADGNCQMMEEARHYLHAHPETGFGLTGTGAYVKERLTDMGYEPKECGRAGLRLSAAPSQGQVFR